MKLPPDIEAKCLKLAGVVSPRKRKPPGVLTGAAPAWAFVLYPACRVISESNSRGHWSVGASRAKAQRAAVLAAWHASPLAMTAHLRAWGAVLPVTVTLTHFGPKMDRDDNLNRAFKAIRDEVARLIGVDDGDECVGWRYAQLAGGPGVEIRIEGAGK